MTPGVHAELTPAAEFVKYADQGRAVRPCPRVFRAAARRHAAPDTGQRGPWPRSGARVAPGGGTSPRLARAWGHPSWSRSASTWGVRGRRTGPGWAGQGDPGVAWDRVAAFRSAPAPAARPSPAAG